MTFNATSTTRAAWVTIIALAMATLIMWLPALHTPFWGDDYVFLLKAHAAHVSAAPWWSDFWPQSPVRFWRPLSQEGYWRLMLACFGGNALAMHAVNLVLHLLASASVGVLALVVAGACRWPRPRQIALFAGLVYATLAMHLLPVHWAAAANNSMLTVFTSLALAAWLHALCTPNPRPLLLLVCIPVLQMLALLTKESAVLIPLLMVVIGLFVRRGPWRRGNTLAWVVCVAEIMLWLFLDRHFTARTDAAYTLTLGFNVIRNGMAFVAWLLNVPRESIRMIMTGDTGAALAWMAAAALPMLGAWFIALRRGHALLSLRQWLAIALFAVVAYGPYFLFSWNSYPYYAAISAILPVIALARLSTDSRRLWLVAMLVVVSSWVAVAGTRQAAQPALIARAHWGENLLQQVGEQPVGAPLWVQISDSRRFYAVGSAGLAWRLGIEPEAIHVTRHCPVTMKHCLSIDKNGHWRWRP